MKTPLVQPTSLWNAKRHNARSEVNVKCLLAYPHPKTARIIASSSTISSCWCHNFLQISLLPLQTFAGLTVLEFPVLLASTEQSHRKILCCWFFVFLEVTEVGLEWRRKKKFDTIFNLKLKDKLNDLFNHLRA